jgi:pantothenate kinase-related protein Tda10
MPYNFLNTDKKMIVDAIMQDATTTTDANTQQTPHVYYLDGPGGTGKTTVYNTLIAMLSQKNIKVCPTITNKYLCGQSKKPIIQSYCAVSF